ncbi:MAG: hypothetical protein MUF18_07760 [Fimbriiglobus sp.]|nr:hypothetical protein [Fimbriiglobus sp.]
MKFDSLTVTSLDDRSVPALIGGFRSLSVNMYFERVTTPPQDPMDNPPPAEPGTPSPPPPTGTISPPTSPPPSPLPPSFSIFRR